MSPLPLKPSQKHRPPRKRQQYRRQNWEESGGLHAVHFHDPDPDGKCKRCGRRVDGMGGVDAGLCLSHYKRTGEVWLAADLILARDPQPFSYVKPLRTRDGETAFRLTKVEKLRERHALRRELHHPADQAKPIDFHAALTRLLRDYREKLVAARGFRGMAHGVSRIDPDSPTTRYRAQFWDKDAGPIMPNGLPFGRHRHLGYRDTYDEAFELVVAYWRDEQGIDMRELIPFDPDSGIVALAELLPEAERLQAEQSAAAGGIAWDRADAGPVRKGCPRRTTAGKVKAADGEAPLLADAPDREPTAEDQAALEAAESADTPAVAPGCPRRAGRPGRPAGRGQAGTAVPGPAGSRGARPARHRAHRHGGG